MIGGKAYDTLEENVIKLELEKKEEWDLQARLAVTHSIFTSIHFRSGKSTGRRTT